MRDLLRLCLGFATLCCAALPGVQPGLQYLDEISHLGTDYDTRTSVSLGRAQAVADEAGNIRFQGRDHAGKVWHAILPISGGIGYTTVWQADFDGNSRSDLLIAALSPLNGRCVNEVTLSFLLFDQAGEPFPWTIDTWTPTSARYPTVPALFVDPEGSGRPKLVATDCREETGDRSFTGIYEAKDAMWHLFRPARVGAYAALVRRSYKMREQDRLLPSQPGDWPDQGNFVDEKTQPQVTISTVLSASPECGKVVRLPIGSDGKVFIDANNTCDEIGKNRIQLSDGRTCYGWPTVMLDRTYGREIVAASELKELEPLLREIAAKRWPVRLAGQKELGKCSPSLLWARDRQ
jgi:hypothetical protein